MFQIGDKQVPLLETQLTLLLNKTRKLWKNRYPCGDMVVGFIMEF
jgi:hypothetical protein